MLIESPLASMAMASVKLKSSSSGGTQFILFTHPYFQVHLFVGPVDQFLLITMVT